MARLVTKHTVTAANKATLEAKEMKGGVEEKGRRRRRRRRNKANRNAL
jgi:hypothetical protein